MVLLGFANAYIILFQGNNPNYRNNEASDLHFSNLGTAFLDMFKGSTGGGLDLVWRGDLQFPNGAAYNGTFPIGDSNLLNLQYVIFILFSLICNVLLLNLLIALMSAVYTSVSEVASAQYRLDKAKLMIGLEDIFLWTNNQTSAPRWLHMVGSITSTFWENSSNDLRSERVKLEAQIMSLMHKNDDQYTQFNLKIDRLDSLLSRVAGIKHLTPATNYSVVQQSQAD